MLVVAETMNVEQLSFEALRRIIRATDVHSRALLRQHNLTGPQLSILKEVARQGQAPIGMLAKATFSGAPTVTGVVDRLENQGLVSRVTSKHDRRQVLITITTAGKRLLRRNPSLLNKSFRDQLVRLPESDQQAICVVLQRVADMMDQDATAE